MGVPTVAGCPAISVMVSGPPSGSMSLESGTMIEFAPSSATVGPASSTASGSSSMIVVVTPATTMVELTAPESSTA